MFDNLSTSLQKAWKSISADGKLTADNVKEPLKDIRRALLEADVSLPVVRRFVKRIEDKALGIEVRVQSSGLSHIGRAQGVQEENKLSSLMHLTAWAKAMSTAIIAVVISIKQLCKTLAADCLMVHLFS